MNLWTICIIGLIVGVIGTGAGGVITSFFKRPSDKVLGFLLGFAGGIMLAIVFGELIPEAEQEGGLLLAMIGLVLGAWLLLLLDLFFPHQHHGGMPEGEAKLWKMGSLLALGIALHNFPEGVALGAGFASGSQLGIGLAIVLALHNIPEGIAMAAPLRAAGKGKAYIIIATILAGIPVGIGALIGAWIGDISPALLTLSLGFAGGAMLYISFDELLPEANFHAHDSHFGIYGGVSGVLIGYLLIGTF
ncbi:MAG: ZIP family metal transporter [Firmicutes bacterium]|nr:ZIP family metal transporter [Bacillota bacterium]